MRLKISTDFEGKPKEFELILTEIFEKLLLNAHVVLLVFDNAEALEDDEELNLSGIRSLRPTSLSPFFVEPTIIVTSRNQNWGIQKVIHLDLWTEAEVVTFVTVQLKLEKNSESITLALQLGTLFGRRPMALQAAVAVILQQIKRGKKYEIQSLIDEYESGSRKVLAQKPLEANMRPKQTSITMLVLWNISMEKIVRFKDGNLAIQILCFMTYMSSARIPQDFLFALLTNSSTEDSFENALEILMDYSLIVSLNSDDDSDFRSFSIHRMIQDSIIENLRTRTNEGQTSHSIFNEATFLNETQVLLKLASESVNYVGKFSPLKIPRRDELVESLVQIARHVMKNLDEEVFRDLTWVTAEVLQVTNNFPKSIELFERALKATKYRNRIEITKKIELMRALAVAYGEGGHLQKSLDLYLKVLEVQTFALGPDHEDTLDTKKGVAEALEWVGRNDEAMAKHQEVLQAYKNKGVTQSADYLQAVVNSEALLFNLGKTKSTSEVLTQVLKELEKDPDSNCGRILTTKNKLALQLVIEGHLEEASKIQLQNIKDATKLVGPFHRITLDCRRDYASTLHHQRKSDQAALLLLELLETEEAQLGPEHTSTLQTKLILGAVYSATKELHKVEAMLDIQVWERVFGPEDMETMKAVYFLSRVKEEQGKLRDALALREKVLKNREQVLGPNHEDTLSTVYTIGVLYYKMDEYEKTAEVTQELLERQEEFLGKDHPDVNKTLEFLTAIRECLNNRNDLIRRFMALTSVDTETGKFLLQASDWKLEVALDTVADINLINKVRTWKNRNRD